jgi:hypothetical protein
MSTSSSPLFITKSKLTFIILLPVQLVTGYAKQINPIGKLSRPTFLLKSIFYLLNALARNAIPATPARFMHRF